MAKTVFSDGNPALGIKGSPKVIAAFLNAIFGHNHQGLDQDGSAPQIVDADVASSAAIAKSKISTSGTFVKADLPATTVHSDASTIFEANGTTVKAATNSDKVDGLHILQAVGTIDFGSVNPDFFGSGNIPLSGVAVGDFAIVSVMTVSQKLQFYAYAVGNGVNVYGYNATGATQGVGSLTVKVVVIK